MSNDMRTPAAKMRAEVLELKAQVKTCQEANGRQYKMIKELKAKHKQILRGVELAKEALKVVS